MDSKVALLVIDVQRAIDQPFWARFGPRNNSEAEHNIARLLDAWRRAGMPVFHVRHDSKEPQSTYRPGQEGHQFKPEALPLAGEPVIGKQTGNAFVGTRLEAALREAGIIRLAIAGVITNNSVESTVRMAGDLGFQTYLAEDACFTFASPDWKGRMRSADEVHAMSLANLHGEYCTVLRTEEVLALLPAGPAAPELGIDRGKAI
jgi:nicotinamidase-related amidase